MSGIFGLLGINAADSDRVFLATIGQDVAFKNANDFFARHNADMQVAMQWLVEETTTNHKLRYKLPGGGRMQERGILARPGAVKAYGEWDVAFELRDFGAQVVESDIAMAYMSVAEFARHLQTVTIQDTNTMRYWLYYHIFNNTQKTFVDPLWGSLTIEPLANGDSVTYPPVLGSESEATDDHYLESGYTAANISDTNNPLVTIRDEIEEHFGTPTGGGSIVVMINNAQRAQIEALSDFDEVKDRFVRQGDNANIPINLPTVPGRIIGRGSGTWVVENRYIPANYMLAVDLEQPGPLKLRVDPDDTNLGRGLQLVARDDRFPLESAFYRNRYGFGVGNRLNGVVMELGTGGSYTIPTAYA